MGLEGNDGNAELLREQGGVKANALVFRDIHHVECKHHGKPELDEFQGKKEVAFERRGIDHMDNHVGSGFLGILMAKDASGDLLIGRIGIEAVAAGEVEDADFCAVRSKAFARFFGDRDTGVIANFLIRSGEGIEEGRFTHVGMADECHSFQKRGHGGEGKSSARFDENLMSEFSGEGEFCAADGAEEIATVGDFFDTHAFTKAHLAQLFTSGALQKADMKLTADFRLFQRNQRVLLQNVRNVCGR